MLSTCGSWTASGTTPSIGGPGLSERPDNRARSESWRLAVPVLGAIGAAIFSTAWSVFWERRAYAPNGSEVYLWLEWTPGCLLLLAALVAVPLGCLALLVRRFRLVGVVALAAAGAFVVTTLALNAALRTHRRAMWDQALQTAADSVEPVLGALEESTRASGAAPDSLAALVPEFLPELPATAVGGWPDYTYLPSPDSDSWSLKIWTPHSLLDFSGLVYRADEVYPAGWKRVVSSMGREWGYEHD